ncbi:MAG: glutamine-hydrolyzing carbamoyl-phosphate synthase small subunit [Deltaproteobacteria bacterium]|nr:glutamine-hydrolyzing carbamoyl-phosphate synthase small subunit [Deltaproteobacteria bacterium]
MTCAWLCMADGTRFEGLAYGAPGHTVGEAVFTTGLTGYQEVLTDPSYCGQLVTMTATQIGNTGCNAEDPESTDDRPKVGGFIVRDASTLTSNWRASESLGAYLERHGIVAIAGIDTRQVTRHLRDRGAQNAAIGTGNPDELVDRARSAPSMEGLDLTRRVTPASSYAWTEGSGAWLPLHGVPGAPPREGKAERHVVVVDLGIKRNILRNLVDFGCRVTAVPSTAAASEILALEPDGIFVSNGPGDPAAVTTAIETLRELLGKRPMFGICLGHQLLALAAGARTFKLKFGHRGINQPVRDLVTGRVEITTQNHGFCVDLESLGGRARSTHVHLNDGTSEGLALDDADAFSVQYHPESAAGPHDSLYLFRRFVERIDARRGAS